MGIVGYADPLSVGPGETVRFMVSTPHREYRADLVRLIHGAESESGPGFKEREIASPIDTTFSGRVQRIYPGSYAVVANADVLALTQSFTLSAWIFPTLPQRDWAQGILTNWHEEAGAGYGVFLRLDGALSVRIGDGSGTIIDLGSGVPLRPREWYYAAARYDAERGLLQLDQRPRIGWPEDATACHVEREATLRISRSSAPVAIAGYSVDGKAASSSIAGHFNGKIEAPRIYNRGLSDAELANDRDGMTQASLLAAWDFSIAPWSARVIDRGPHRLDGTAINMPMRAATGHAWTGAESNPRLAPEQYAAIHFHEDDLDDCGWSPDFSLEIPENLPSGVYAARLRAGDAEEHIPLFVRPRLGAPTAQIAFLVPTNTYLAYGNEQGTESEDSPHLPLPRQNPEADARELAHLRATKLLSLYDFHADGSGVCYASRRRPILNMRPRARARHIDAPHAFPASGHEVDRCDRHLGTPAHACLLATATGFSDLYQGAIEDVLMNDGSQGGGANPRVRADMVYLEYPHGGAVFSVGSIAWMGSLSAHNYQNDVAQITGNVLRRFAGNDA